MGEKPTQIRRRLARPSEMHCRLPVAFAEPDDGVVVVYALDRMPHPPHLCHVLLAGVKGAAASSHLDASVRMENRPQPFGVFLVHCPHESFE